MAHSVKEGRENGLIRTLKVATLAAVTLPGIRHAQSAEPVHRPLVSPSAQVEREAKAVRVHSVAGFLSAWTPENQLYVQGQVPLSEGDQVELASFLKTRPNWTVYLLERAEGQSWKDAWGGQWSGFEAVNQALKEGLHSIPAFKALKDQQHGLENGAVMYISFDVNRAHRKVAYYPSELQARAGAGRDHWEGELDQRAIAKLRSKPGPQVFGAVTDTITSIDAITSSYVPSALTGTHVMLIGMGGAAVLAGGVCWANRADKKRGGTSYSSSDSWLDSSFIDCGGGFDGGGCSGW